MIDNKDIKILNILQDDAHATNADIARQVGMVASGVFERTRKLEEKGVIQGYGARLDPTRLGLGMLAFMYIRTDDRVGNLATANLLAKIPEVQEVHHIAGEDCYLVKVRAANTNDLARIMRERFGKIKAIRSTRTTIVLETVKETARLPLRTFEVEEEG